MISKFNIEHFKNWNEWRKTNNDSFFHHLLVLFRLRSSTSFYTFLMCKNVNAAMASFIEGINTAAKRVGEFTLAAYKAKNPDVLIGIDLACEEDMTVIGGE